MKILYAKWPSLGRKDIKAAFLAEGHELAYFPVPLVKGYPALETDSDLILAIRKEKPDLVFSTDYFSKISEACNKEKVRYLSWTYDSPYQPLYSKTVLNPCNVICIFDRELCHKLHSAGVSTAHYMPLAADVERLDALCEGRPQSFSYDVSFVGSLYIEDGKFNQIDRVMPYLSDYAKGYFGAMINAQLKIQGYDFVEDLLHPIIDTLWEALPVQKLPDGMEALETREYLWAQYIVNRRLTTLERLDALEAIAVEGGQFVDFFTKGIDFTMDHVRNRGLVDYDSDMPIVFRDSKINLNITLRGIHSGIPLRAFDIMGSGGFLLSNFQADFLEHFVPGEDFVFYENREDLIRKVKYYLSHEDERRAIAQNGHDKVAAEHTYRHRVREMMALL